MGSVLRKYMAWQLTCSLRFALKTPDTLPGDITIDVVLVTLVDRCGHFLRVMIKWGWLESIVYQNNLMLCFEWLSWTCWFRNYFGISGILKKKVISGISRNFRIFFFEFSVVFRNFQEFSVVFRNFYVFAGISRNFRNNLELTGSHILSYELS
jgi:hypothetical protein